MRMRMKRWCLFRELKFKRVLVNTRPRRDSEHATVAGTTVVRIE